MIDREPIPDWLRQEINVSAIFNSLRRRIYGARVPIWIRHFDYKKGRCIVSLGNRNMLKAFVCNLTHEWWWQLGEICIGICEILMKYAVYALRPPEFQIDWTAVIRCVCVFNSKIPSLLINSVCLVWFVLLETPLSHDMEKNKFIITSARDYEV